MNSEVPNNEINNNNNYVLNRNRSKYNLRKSTSLNKNFSFWNTICFTVCIPNTKKRNFINLIAKLIDNKLSIEYFLEFTNNFEILKKLTLKEEEYENFDKLPNLNLDEQLKEFNILNKINT